MDEYLPALYAIRCCWAAQGPFDGVLGFSEGATVGALLGLERRFCPGLAWAVLCGGALVAGMCEVARTLGMCEHAGAERIRRAAEGLGE